MIKRIFAWPRMAVTGFVERFEDGVLNPDGPNKHFPLWLIALTVLICAIPIGGCSLAAPATAGTSAPTSVVSVVSDKVVVEGGRALILANLAYQTVGTAAAVGIEQGVITGETKVKVQRASQKAVDALDAGQRALLAGDKAAAAVAAMGAVDELCGLHSVLARACSAIR